MLAMTRRSHSQYTSSKAALAEADLRPFRVAKSEAVGGKYDVIDNRTEEVVAEGLSHSTARRRRYALEGDAGFVAKDPHGLNL